MVERDDLVYVAHIIEIADKILLKTKGKSRDDFDRDEDLRIVLTHLLQIIGETSRNISPEYQRDHPQIPWKAIIGMRHKIVHDYLQIDEDAVWATVRDDIPALIGLLSAQIPTHT